MVIIQILQRNMNRALTSLRMDKSYKDGFFCFDSSAAEENVIVVGEHAEFFVKFAHEEHAWVALELDKAVVLGELQHQVIVVVVDANGEGVVHGCRAHHLSVCGHAVHVEEASWGW